MSDQSEVDTTEADRLLLDCRVCLLEKPVSLMSWDIFTPWTEKGLTAGATIASELSELAKIDIQDVEGYPRYICKSCLEKLVSAIELVGDVKKSEKILTQKKQKGKLSPEQKWPKPIELDKSLNEEVLRNSMDVDVKQEMISDEEIGETGMDDDRQDNLSLLDIKLEPEDITEHPAIQVTVNGTISHAQHDQISSMTNGFEVYENEEYLESNSDPVIKEEPLSDEDAPADLPMYCILCTKQFNTLSGLKAHVIAHHNYKSVKRKSSGSASPAKGNALASGLAAMSVTKYVCNICKRNFTTSTDLKVHEVCHDKFTCFACDAKFDSFGEVSRHRRRCKAKQEAVKPKTLRDILNERLAQKQLAEQTKHELPAAEQMKNATLNSHSKTKKSEHREMVEIEINIKKEVPDELMKDDDIKIKTEVDYNKIETELEGMFENAFDKPDINISIEQKDQSDSNEISKDNKSRNSVDSIDDKGKEIDTTSSKDQVLNANIDKQEHTKLNEIVTVLEGFKDNNEETNKSMIIDSSSEICNNVKVEQNPQDCKNIFSELKSPVEVNEMEVEPSDTNILDENIDINNSNKISNSKTVNEKCEDSHDNAKTDLVRQCEKETDKEL